MFCVKLISISNADVQIYIKYTTTVYLIRSEFNFGFMLLTVNRSLGRSSGVSCNNFQNGSRPVKTCTNCCEGKIVAWAYYRNGRHKIKSPLRQKTYHFKIKVIKLAVFDNYYIFHAKNNFMRAMIACTRVARILQWGRF